MELPKSGARVIRHALQENLFAGWTNSLYFEVPFLGARFSASDAGVTGGLLLVIVSVWCFYAARRENHLIFYLVRDCERYQFTLQMRRYLRNQLHATQIFAGTSVNAALDDTNFVGTVPHQRQLTMKVLSGAMFASAPIALAFVLFTDLYSLQLNSPFRGGGKLFEVFWNPCFRAEAGVAEDCHPVSELVTRLMASAAFFALCSWVMVRGYEFQKASQRLLSHLDKRERKDA